MKFDQHMEVDDPKVDLEGQGHRSKVKVTRSKSVISGPIGAPYWYSLRSRVTWVKIKGHIGQGQRSTLKVKGQGHQVKNVISDLI